MTPITLEQYLNEPDLGLRLYAEARRERAATVRWLLKALLARLTPQARPTRPTRAIHWIARLG